MANTGSPAIVKEVRTIAVIGASNAPVKYSQEVTK
jgi:predicted CoA-binding protein